MSLSRCTRAWLVAFVTFGVALFPCSAEEPPDSYVEGIVTRLFATGALSYFFDEDVQAIADRYVRGTKYSGKVRVNKPRQRGQLNVYVFHYVEGLPRFLANNCNAFPRDGLILCDHALFDSIPATYPLVFKQGDGVQLPFVLQWIIGHEIGHILFEDLASGFGRAPATPLVSTSPSTSDTRSRELHATDSIEVRADRFAIRGLEMISDSARLQLGSQLTDALNWEVTRLKTTVPAPPKSNAGEAQRFRFWSGNQETLVIEAVRGRHPPLAVRLANLLNEMILIYARYPVNSLLAPSVHFDIRYDESVSSDDTLSNQLFYGGFYVGSDFDPVEKQRMNTERILEMLTKGHRLEASGMARKACQRFVEDAEPWSSLRFVSCMMAAVPFEGVEPRFPECNGANAVNAGRCFGLLLLLANVCETKTSSISAPLCRAPEVFLREYERYQNLGLKFQPDERLLSWAPIQEYRFRRQTIGLNENLNKWIGKSASTLAEAGFNRAAKDLVDQAMGDDDPGHIDDVRKTIQLLVWKRTLESRLLDDSAAIASSQRAIELLDQNFPKDWFARAGERYELGKMTRFFRVGVYGESDAKLFVDMSREDSASLDKTAENQTRQLSVRVLLEAADIYSQGYDAEGEIAPTKERRRFLKIGYLNSLSAAIFSMNVGGVQIDVRALPLARALMLELQKTPDWIKDKDFAQRTEAHALANIAAAEMSSAEGDSQAALSAALRAHEIWSATAMPNLDILRTLAYAYFLTGDRMNAKVKSEEFMQAWERDTGRTFNVDSVLLLKNKPVTFGSMVAEPD